MADPDFTNEDIFIANLQNSTIQQLTDMQSLESSPYWLANGMVILFESNNGPDPEHTYLWMIDLRTGEGEIVSQQAIRGKCAIDKDRGYFYAMSDTETGTGIYRFNPSQSTEELLIEIPCSGREFVLSPEGNELVIVADCSGQVDIYRLAIGSDEIIELTNDRYEESKLVWISPTLIGYIVEWPNEEGVILLDLETMQSGVFFSAEDIVSELVWVP